MAFRILPGEAVQEGIQRVAREQIDKALDELDDPELDRHDVVHQVRKRCKKIRGLVRLVRPQFESTYDRENTWYRDAARRLSYARDAQSVIETFDELMEHYDDHVDASAFAAIRSFLTCRRKEIADDEVELGERLDEFRDRIEEGRERVAAWRLQDEEFDAVAGGLEKTYARCRTAMAAALAEPSTEAFHEWRKRVKYHWCHMRLLRCIWEGPMKARRDEADDLGDDLGDDHDLAALRETLVRHGEDVGDADAARTLLGLIAQRQTELRTKASTAGACLFAEKPKRLVKRLGRYWDAWRDETRSGSAVTHDPGLVTA